MNETNKFVDSAGDSLQAIVAVNGCIDVCTFGVPYLTPDQAIEFAKQLTELAQEVKGNG